MKNYISAYKKVKFPPSHGSWKVLLKTIYIRQLLVGIPSGVVTASLFLAPIGLPLFIAQWVWTIEYIFRTRKDFPIEKQYQNMIFGILAIFPLTYILIFFLIPLAPVMLLLYFLTQL